MRIGTRHTEKTKQKIKSARANQVFTEETRKKISETQKGKKHSEETKKKMKESHKIYKGENNPAKRPEVRKKISEAKKGEKSYLWLGGKSFEPYTIDWTKTLRQSIRERDKYICQLCREKQGDRALSVHHIDYNKKNNNPDNLISLCRNCHSKTNFNRNYWKQYFGLPIVF